MMKQRKIARLCAAVVLSVAAQVALAAGPASLKVLLVGNDPATAKLPSYQQGSEHADRSLKMLQERTADFERLLRQHFSTVKVVYGAAYKESMSAGYDVTVFDALPPMLKPEIHEKDAQGRTTRYEPPHYLTAGFSDAAVLISSVSPRISEPLHYKMDWLCLCLDAHAHGMKLGHPIFNTPNKVKTTLTSQATPPNYKQYFYAGRNLPERMPMWRVQNEGYMDGKGYPAGLVSTGSGFEEGGDAEVISSGVCAKGPDAVALGRHGNFFHWGFSASPQDMTPEGQMVFINAVHYIAKYKGQRPYSRRPERGDHAREWAVERAYMSAQRSASAGAQASVTAGSPAPAAAVDANAIISNYQANLEYLRPAARGAGNRGGGYEVDEDVRSLSTSNRDPQLLDLCVSMLESNVEMEKATRILTRYTGESFKSPQEWRQWLERNRGKFYFSDLDGFRFHVAPR